MREILSAIWAKFYPPAKETDRQNATEIMTDRLFQISFFLHHLQTLQEMNCSPEEINQIVGLELNTVLRELPDIDGIDFKGQIIQRPSVDPKKKGLKIMTTRDL